MTCCTNQYHIKHELTVLNEIKVMSETLCFICKDASARDYTAGPGSWDTKDHHEFRIIQYEVRHSNHTHCTKSTKGASKYFSIFLTVQNIWFFRPTHPPPEPYIKNVWWSRSSRNMCMSWWIFVYLTCNSLLRIEKFYFFF